MRYKITDKILGSLSLPQPTKIEIEITEERVALFVGQRDWEWDGKTGELISCGTRLR